jgi:hypothetical protein
MALCWLQSQVTADPMEILETAKAQNEPLLHAYAVYVMNLSFFASAIHTMKYETTIEFSEDKYS